jgi:rhodanese-related sulfurtransferase
MQQISARQLADWIAECERVGEAEKQRQEPYLLDVREPWEYELCHLAGSISIPMNTVPAHLDKLDVDADVVVICHHGMRSMQVAMFLEQNGFSSIYNLVAGVNAWAHDVDPAMSKY